MTETQILTSALASMPTVVAVIIGILINNSRLNDIDIRISELRSQMDIRFDDIRDTWRAER